MRQNNQFAVINQKYIMSFCEWLWARICTHISSDDSLKFRDRICHSFLFFFCYALWRCFGEIDSSVQFFCISDRFSYCVTVFFTQKAHFWPCGDYLNMRGTFQPHTLKWWKTHSAYPILSTCLWISSFLSEHGDRGIWISTPRSSWMWEAISSRIVQ